MNRRLRTRPGLEVLEDRRVPAILLALDSGGNLTGIFGNLGTGPGTLLLDFNNSNQVAVSENGMPLGEYLVSGNLYVSLGNTVLAAPTVSVQLDGFELSGNLRLNLGNALNGYTVNIDAAAGGTVSGNLYVNTGSGNDTLTIANNNDVQGSAYLSLGAGVDSVAFVDGVDIAGNATITGGNQVNINTVGVTPVNIGGSLYVNSVSDSRNAITTDYDIGELATIAGNAILSTGSSILDSINVLGDILGSLYVNMGQGENRFMVDSTSTVSGNLSYTGGNGIDSVSLVNGGSILGRVTVNAGNGANDFDFQAGFVIAGNILFYRGGNGIDSVFFNGQAVGASVYGVLGGGNDILTVDANMILGRLYVDFGFGTDVLNSTGVFSYPTTFRSLP